MPVIWLASISNRMICGSTPPHMHPGPEHRLKSFQRCCSGNRTCQQPRFIWAESAMLKRYGGLLTYTGNSGDGRVGVYGFGPAILMKLFINSRGRNAGYPAPPTQTRTCGFSHPVLRLHSLPRGSSQLPVTRSSCYSPQ
jgi:hypothetical protein